MAEKTVKMLLDPGYPDKIRKMTVQNDVLSALEDLAPIGDYEDMKIEDLKPITIAKVKEFVQNYKPITIDMKYIRKDFPVELKNYRVDPLKLVARGGMGEIYEVEEKPQYVVKVTMMDTKHSLESQPQAGNKVRDDIFCTTKLELIQREFTIAQLMSDLNIGPKVYEAAIGPKNAYLVMDRYDDNLQALLHEQKSLPEYKEFYDSCMKNVEWLIARMHEAGIIHFDTKPANILYRVKEDDTIDLKIGDYGLAFFSNDERLREKDREMIRDDFDEYAEKWWTLKLQFTKDGVPCFPMG